MYLPKQNKGELSMEYLVTIIITIAVLAIILGFLAWQRGYFENVIGSLSNLFR